MTFTNANETVVVAKRFFNGIFNFSQLRRKQVRLAIGLHQCRIIAVGGNIDNALGRDAQQVIAR